MADKPNFALLIGKPKGAEADKPTAPGTDETATDLGVKDDGMDQGGAEDSAVKDLMTALSSKDVASAKQALQDFLEICYPQLTDADGDAGSEPDDSSGY